jgi:hypothetical protein
VINETLKQPHCAYALLILSFSWMPRRLLAFATNLGRT